MNSSILKNQHVLQRRPEARGFRVEQLLREASDGRLRIPEFQRPLRWQVKNVIEFFDSIRRGFPVGELLLSRAPAKAKTLHFGTPVTVESPAQPAALWVVDGQQRLTALVATMLRRDSLPRSDRWAIWYDLSEEKFVHCNTIQPEPSWIPLNVLGDSASQMRWMRKQPDLETETELVDRAIELGKSLREFEMPGYIVEGVDETTLRLIFTRANTSGIDMRENEIFEALYGKEGDKPIQSAVARLCDAGFGQLDEDLFLRCLRMVCDVSSDEVLQSPDNLPADSIRRTESALRRAIQTIQGAAGIPHWKLMPYRLPLVFLAGFFDRFPEPDSRLDRQLARWIWRGVFTGDHNISQNLRIRELLAQSKNCGTAEKAVAKLLEPFDRSWTEQCERAAVTNLPEGEFDRDVSLRRASAKVFVLGLLANNPRRQPKSQQLTFWELAGDDVETTETETDILLATENDSSDNESDEDRNSLNPAKITRSLTEKKFGTDIIIKLPGMTVEEIHGADAGTLQSFLLDENSITALRKGDLDRFRLHRRRVLDQYFQQFVADRWGDAVDIRPAIRAITATVMHSVGFNQTNSSELTE